MGKINHLEIGKLRIEIERMADSISLKQATPTELRRDKLELRVSTGGYSRDHRAIVIVAGIANPTPKEHQVLGWELSFPSKGVLGLQPTAFRPNLLADVGWWTLPTASISPEKFTQHTLFFRVIEEMPQGLVDEPWEGHLIAKIFGGEELKGKAVIYRMATLQENPSLYKQ
ncbi:MAG: hypothetical protein ACRD4X_17610 [Candidatus Acidiferrales bacterium]